MIALARKKEIQSVPFLLIYLFILIHLPFSNFDFIFINSLMNSPFSSINTGMVH